MLCEYCNKILDQSQDILNIVKTHLVFAVPISSVGGVVRYKLMLFLYITKNVVIMNNIWLFLFLRLYRKLLMARIST